MARVYRQDLSDTPLKSSYETPEGFVYASGHATKVGVFPYRDENGQIVMELRPEEEVSDPESMASMAMKPLTREHPTQDVTPDNWQDLAAGQTGQRASYAGGYVSIDVCLSKKDAIRDYRNGVTQLSGGYTCELDATPGVWNGQPYQVVQRNIRYNHLALVNQGRLGSDVALRADSAGDSMNEEEKKAFEALKAERDAERKARIDAEATIKGLQTNLDAQRSKTDALQGERDALKVRADSAPDLLGYFNRRMPLIEMAKARKIDGIEKLDNAQLSREIAKTLVENFDATASDDYVAGVLSMIPQGTTQVLPTKTQTDGADADARLDAAYAVMNARNTGGKR